MRTSLAGNSHPRAGVTLLEMLIVLTLISLMAGISYPSLSAGIESLRLNQACEETAALLNSSLARSSRRQQAVEIIISRQDNLIAALSEDGGLNRRVPLPGGVTIAAILPPIPADEMIPRRFLILPGSAPPRIGILFNNARGDRRALRLDPITGVPQIERLDRDQQP